MIPYGRQSIDKDDIRAVARVLRSDWLTQGPAVKSFEQALADYCGATYAVVTSNGTTGLHLAYLAAGLKKGDEAITTPNTFVATSNMLFSVGARPVFCDIRLDTFNIDEKQIESLICPKTKAIVPVHFAGNSCEMETILKIARKHKLVVIEDACHAIGAKYKNKKIGSIGDMTVFSFHPVKSITTGEGGAVLTNNKKYYERLLHFRSHGISKDKNGFNVMSGLGHNYRMTDIQAALGESQLKKLDRFIEKRHAVVSWYENSLNGIDEILLPRELPGQYHGWHIYIIRVKNKKKKLPLYKYLLQNGVGVNFHYPAVYSHPYYRKNGYKNVQLKNMDEYHDSCVTLPCHTKLTSSDVLHIGRTIKKFFRYGDSTAY